MRLIPAEYKLAAIGIAVAILCALAAAGGAVVATWKAEAACGKATDELQGQIAKLKDEKHALELAIEEVSKGAAVAQAQTQAASQAQAQAQQHAAELATFSKSRMDKLESAFRTATSCGDVLDQYWELRK